MIFSLKRFSISIDERVLPIFSGGGGAQLFVATLVALSPGEGGILVHSYDIACHIVCVCVWWVYCNQETNVGIPCNRLNQSMWD